MLNRLRVRLTVLYLLVAVALMVFVGAGAYTLLHYYFEDLADLGLKYKMAREMISIGVPLPHELEMVRDSWRESRVSAWSGANTVDDGEKENEGGEEPEETGEIAEFLNNTYESELAGIFVFPLDSSARLLYDPNPFPPPMTPDAAAARSALENGSDLRTAALKDGTPVRLLTYRLMREDEFMLLQLGRPLGDQQVLLQRFLTGLLILGGVIVLALGGGSWWLAGRSLNPMQRAWEQQQAFIANASHELRAPLTLIRAGVEVAQRHPANATQKALLDDALEDCDYMNRLVEDLLLLSRLDHQRLALESKEILLKDFLSDLQRQMERVAAQQSVTVSLGNITGTVLGDPIRLRQVLLIVLDNALHSLQPGGSIHLEAREAGRQVEIRVTDTGAGIAAEHLPHIFERFYKVSHTERAEMRGSGLGLSIARALVEAQGGSIGLQSSAGQGTCVTIRLNSAPHLGGLELAQ